MAVDKVLLQAQALGRRASESGAWLFQDACLDLRGGDRVALSGPSGSGKTVLLRALALLDPLDAGMVLWRGAPVDGSDVPPFRARVIYVQQRHSLCDGSVEANLQLPFDFGVHASRSLDRAHAESLLARLGRDPSFLPRQERDLSGGEVQMVALVRTLLLEPQVLLLDEPTAAMDRTTTEAAECLVSDWASEAPSERAFLWVTHDAEQSARVANRWCRIEAGHLTFESSLKS